MLMLYKNSYWHIHILSNNAYLSFILLNEYCIVIPIISGFMHGVILLYDNQQKLLYFI